ncbi:MAG: hypothetical protein HY585_05540, partial [Candidatus Omnitrophica bacterium]|nr:hypothetical protein [Candidatus Omnitrophota bacterium]
TVTLDATFSAGTFDANDLAVTINGNTTIDGGTFKTGTGVVTFGDSASADTMTISSGNLHIESNADSDIVRNLLSWTNSGGTITYNGSSVSISLLSALSAYNNLVINGSGSTYTSDGDFTVSGTLNVTAGTLDISSGTDKMTMTGTLTVDGGTLTATNGDIDANGNVTVSSGTLTAPTAADDTSFTVTGSWSVTSSGIFTPGSGRVIFDGTASGKTITSDSSGADDFGDFKVTGSGGVWTLADALDSTGAITISAGTLALSTFKLTIGGALSISGTGTLSAASGDIDANGNIVVSDGLLTAPTAADDTSFTVAGSWAVSDTATFTPGTGRVVFDATSGTPTITTTDPGTNAFNDIVFNDGAGEITFTLEDSLDVDGNLTITDGTLDTKSGESNSINLAGSWTLNSNGSFTARSGTVTLDAANGVTQTLDGTTTFYTLSKTVTGATTLSLDDADVFTVSNSLTLKGTSGNLLTVTSDDGTNTVDFDLSSGGIQDLDYLTPIRIDSADGVEMNPNNCTGATGNVNWRCGGGASLSWDGSSSTAWNTNANWNLGFVPRSSDTVTIPDASTDPSLGSATTITNLTIQSGAVLTLGGNDLTVSTTFTNEGGLTLQGDESVSTPSNANPSTVTFTATSSSRAIKNWTYHHLTINGSGGTFTLAADQDESLGGDLTVTAGTFDISANTQKVTVAGTLTVNGGTLTATDGDIDANGNVTVSSGTLTAPTAADDTSFTVTGSWSVTSSGVFTPGSGRVIFDGTASGKTITSDSSGADDFGVFKVTGSGGVWTLADALDSTGAITISAGTLSLSTYKLTSGGILTISGGTLTATSGDIDADSDIICTSGTLTAPTAADDTSFLITGSWEVSGS